MTERTLLVDATGATIATEDSQIEARKTEVLLDVFGLLSGIYRDSGEQEKRGGQEVIMAEILRNIGGILGPARLQAEFGEWADFEVVKGNP